MIKNSSHLIKYDKDCLIYFYFQCKNRGCSAVEFDLALTKDGVPIIFHDLTIERLTGKTGTIRDMNWKDLRELDITHNHPLRYNNVPKNKQDQINIYGTTVTLKLKKKKRNKITNLNFSNHARQC